MSVPVAESHAHPRAELVIDLDAIRDNVMALRSWVEPAHVMVVVKADGYGHGMLHAARAARAGGATWLGVAVVEEAVALRAAGDNGRILSWLAVPGEDYRPAIEAGVALPADYPGQLRANPQPAQAMRMLARH